MTDPESFEIIDRLVMMMMFPEDGGDPQKVLTDAIAYLMRYRREHPEHELSARLWGAMAERGLLT